MRQREQIQENRVFAEMLRTARVWLADGAPLSGNWMTIGELKDGLIRGSDFDRRCEQVISRRLGKMDEKDLAENCRSIGAKITESNADFAVTFDFLLYDPVMLKVWFADGWSIDYGTACGSFLVA